MDSRNDPPSPTGPGATQPTRPDGGRRRSHSTLRNTVEWVAVIAGAVLIALVVRNFVVQSYQIPSGSMEETLLIGDRVLVNHLSYRLHDINRGDVIVFSRPDTAPADPGDPDDLIKRAIGLPGETIQSIDGVVHIDGKPLDEPYLGPGTATFDIDEPVVVPEGEVFVLGDNRGNSEDSRYIGSIPTDTVTGRAFAIIWPLSRFSGL
ncbi:MAG: signal peptidase I [Actinomycetia bacterium]|nr:signal peptidase I [Actinomycetes bacterium]